MTQRPYIEYSNVEVAFNRLVSGLKGVNLRINRGEFVYVVGQTGSGKSTLLKLLSHQVVATGGAVTFDGQNLGALSIGDIPALRRRMGIVPQDFGLLPRKSAWENIAYAMRAIGKSRGEVRRSVGKILESVSIGHRADAFPEQLSGGEQQRLAIARALINSPELIVADEPTGNLDPETSIGVIQVLADLNQKGVTILVATHDAAIVSMFPARVVRLENGRIVEDSAPNA